MKSVKVRSVGSLKLQFNPARMVSSGAKIDKATIAKRPCFLCSGNRPAVQMVRRFNENFDILVNPFPILPVHFTIPARQHQLQLIEQSYGVLHRLVDTYPEWMFFYNGPKCGASAPDHLHFQGGTKGLLPLQEQWSELDERRDVLVELNDSESISFLRDFAHPAIVIKSRSEVTDKQMFGMVYRSLPLQSDDAEPMMNIIAWKEGLDNLSVVFPRRKHRPDCYSAVGDEQYLISPGALDMGGLIILPREEDYERLAEERLTAIMREIVLSPKDMEEVAQKIKVLNKQKSKL